MSVRNSEMSPLSLVPLLRNGEPPKATQPVSDKPGMRIQTSGTFQWPLGIIRETSQYGGSSQVEGLLVTFAGGGFFVTGEASKPCSEK